MTTSSLLRALLLALLAWSTAALAADPLVLLRSDNTIAFLRANGGDHDRLMAPWRGFFSRHGLKVRELPAAELGALQGPAVLILGSTVALDEAERQAIRSRLKAGWSVLGTWAVGVRDEKGGWKGYGFVQELFGAEVVADSARGKDDFLLPFGETPVTHALPAGKRVYLTRTTEPFLRVRARNAAARFGSYAREVTPSNALLGAAAFDERDGARRAFFGFAETTWDSAQADVDAMLLGALDWLRRKPIVIKSAWPHPHQAAVLLEMDTEDKFENSVNFAQQLERHGIRGTFYTLTSEALKHPEVVKRLASKHEIAYHADVHNGFAKLATKNQDARLGAMIRDLGTILPNVKSVATGFRAPFEEYDAVTEKLLRAHGLRHHAASPDSRPDMLPGFSTAEPGLSFDQAIVVLPRTWIDDIALFKSALVEKSSAEKILLEHLQDTVAMRGFGLLSLHTQNFAAGSPMERGVARLLETIAKSGGRVWAPSGAAIERWWRDREAVQVAVRHESGAVRIQLKAARGPVKGLRLVVMPPSQEKIPRLQGSAKLEKLDDYRWAIVLPELQQGESELRVSF